MTSDRGAHTSEPSYDVYMKKRRITLNLDADVVEALESMEGRSVSAVANEALRAALAVAAHRTALARWLDELDTEHGAATAEELALVEQVLDEFGPADDQAGVA